MPFANAHDKSWAEKQSITVENTWVSVTFGLQKADFIQSTDTMGSRTIEEGLNFYLHYGM